jgi:hypothetical protein
MQYPKLIQKNIKLLISSLLRHALRFSCRSTPSRVSLIIYIYQSLASFLDSYYLYVHDLSSLSLSFEHHPGVRTIFVLVIPLSRFPLSAIYIASLLCSVCVYFSVDLLDIYTYKSVAESSHSFSSILPIFFVFFIFFFLVSLDVVLCEIKQRKNKRRDTFLYTFFLLLLYAVLQVDFLFRP